MKRRSNPLFMLRNQYYVYLLTNWNNKVLYVGVTNDLKRRLYEHQNGLQKGFTQKYHLNKLVYYEICEEIEGAILREKQIKGGSRQKKNDLVAGFNPG
ncbi:MAG: GIY-YIG nuclease family protein [Candidatus Omnitrophota bacterium]